MRPAKRRIGFVSTRFAGTDGVSLETFKWAKVLNRLNCECFYFAGECELPEDHCYVVEEAHFDHPEVRALTVDLFDDFIRSSETSGKIQSLRFYLKKHLYKFVEQFDIDLLIVENALAIPMNIPLGLALTEFIAETMIPTIAHHHDFGWERSRFKISAASDYQYGVFPPILPSVQHVVINSYGSRQLALRTGASSTLIPNVMDFDNPPPPPDGYANDLRQSLGISSDEFMLLQPTRIVPRKRIELAIDLASRLDLPCTLVISHAAGDEGTSYEAYLKKHADLIHVRVLFMADHFDLQRGISASGDKIYSLADIYQHSDLVTYPSTIEGFGNAFLETLYYKKPIVMSTYEIFRIDIEPKGFKNITFGDYITDETVEQVQKLLGDNEMVEEMCEINYELARRFFSYNVLESRLAVLLNECLGTFS